MQKLPLPIPSLCLRGLVGVLWLLGFSWASGQLYPVRLNGLWGLINAEGKLVAEPRYAAVDPQPNGYSVVVEAGKFGLLDQDGQVAVPTDYTFLKQLRGQLWATNQGGECDEQGCVGGRWGLYHVGSGRDLAPAYQLLQDATLPGYILANVGGKCNYKDCEGGKWALIDTAAQVLLPPLYDAIQPLAGRQAFVKKGNLWGLYDLGAARLVIEPLYSELTFITSHWLNAEQGGVAGLLNQRGDTVIGFRHLGYADAGRGYLQYKGPGGWGLMDSTGRILTTTEYESVRVGGHGWVFTQKPEGMGLMNVRGKAIFGNVLGACQAVGANYAVVSQGLAWGVIDSSGKVLVPILYEKVEVVGDSLFRYDDHGIMKWVRLDGKVVKGVAFDKLEPFVNNVAKVEERKKRGLVNREGRWIVPAKYDELNVMRNVAQARNGNGDWEYFYFDDEGRPSQVRRIILVKEDDRVEAVPSVVGGPATGSMGWFIGGKRKWGLMEPETGKVRITPRYLDAIVVTGRLSLVERELSAGGGGNTGWGVVNHERFVETIAPVFQKVFVEEFDSGPTARGIMTNGRYGLILREGELADLSGATYIRRFSENLAAVCIGGRELVSDELRPDSVAMRWAKDKRTGERLAQAVYIEGGKWGFINREGKWVKPAEFEQAMPFKGGLAAVKVNGKWGVVDTKLNFVVEPKYDFVEHLKVKSETRKETQLLTVGHVRNRYGFIDTLGEVVVQPQFQEAGAYRESLARVKVEGLWGYADMQGQMVIAARYKEAMDFHGGLARVRNGRYWGFINAAGEAVTPEQFLRAGDLHGGRAWVQVGSFFGYVDETGQMVIPAKYAQAGDFSQGVAVVREKRGTGVIDDRGKWVIPPKYYRIQAFKDSLAVVQDGAAFGLAKLDGDLLVKPKYKGLQAFSEGMAVFRDGMGYGYLDSTGAVAIGAQYANAGPFRCGLGPILEKGRWGFIDSAGTVVIAAQYLSVQGFHEGRAAVRMGQQWGFINLKGELAVPASYDKVGNFSNGRAPVYLKDHGWGFVNMDGTLVVPCKYEAVGHFQNGIVPVCLDRKWGLLNPYGVVVTLLKYDQIGSYEHGLAKVKMTRCVGVVDEAGKVLAEPVFDSVKFLQEVIQVEQNDRLGYLNLKGEWLWQPSK